MEKFPDLMNQPGIDNFERTGEELEKNISRIGFLIQELSPFIYQYLLNDGISIVDKTEKDALWDIYIADFENLTKEVITSLKEYDEMIKNICKNLQKMRLDAVPNFREYLVTAPDIQDDILLVSPVIGGFAGIDLLSKILLATSSLGVAFTAALSAICLMGTYKEIEEALRRNEAVEQNNIQDVEEEVKRIDKSMMKIIEDLVKMRKTLKEICSGNESGNLGLIEKISNTIDNKIKGTHLSSADRNQLLEKKDTVENNLRRLKDFFFSKNSSLDFC